MKFLSSSQRARICAAVEEGARVGGEVAGQVEGGRGQDARSGRREEAGEGTDLLRNLIRDLIFPS